jgi:hypothetical protein
MMTFSPACLRVMAAKWISHPFLPDGTMPEMREEGFGIGGSRGELGIRLEKNRPFDYEDRRIGRRFSKSTGVRTAQ